MKAFREPNLTERRDMGASAKKAQLDKVLALKAKQQEGLAEHLAERARIAEEREARAVERKAKKLEQEKREAEERAAAEVARVQAEKIALAIRERDAAEKAAREVALEATRKAARDARYAARQKRKG